ncbi:hypothetical protein D8770_15350 [Methylobacterium sp. DB1607]|nr:hypothetical protein [Methylobacterium sp. DB1607]
MQPIASSPSQVTTTCRRTPIPVLPNVTRTSSGSGALRAASCPGSTASTADRPSRRPNGIGWLPPTVAGRYSRSIPATGRTSPLSCPSRCGPIGTQSPRRSCRAT